LAENRGKLLREVLMMASKNRCDFCNHEEIKDKLPDGTDCRRSIYEDDFSLAILAPEQYTIGHTLLILKNHRTDITDDISGPYLLAFINAIHKVSVQLKDRARNDLGKQPERIYVAILCDGVEHLHAHLIPRYPFTELDEEDYRTRFTPTRGEKAVGEAIKSGKLGGFWYVAERERPESEKAEILEERASELRIEQ
jgi:diadenosine tetraphosphate (Ap4A) HIT family hydrolase